MSFSLVTGSEYSIADFYDVEAKPGVYHSLDLLRLPRRSAKAKAQNCLVSSVHHTSITRSSAANRLRILDTDISSHNLSHMGIGMSATEFAPSQTSMI